MEGTMDGRKVYGQTKHNGIRLVGHGLPNMAVALMPFLYMLLERRTTSERYSISLIKKV
jgi:hypothetical protein